MFGVAVCAYIIHAVNQSHSLNPPLTWFLPAIVISSYLGGLIPGLVTTAVSSAMACFFFPGPFWNFAMDSSNDVFRLVVFLATGAGVSTLFDHIHRERRSAENAIRKWQTACRGLEAEIEGRKIAQQRLRKKENEMNHILKAVPVGISFIDAYKRYRFCNQTFAAWLNQKRENLIGSPVERILPPEHYKRVAHHYEEVFSGKRVEFDDKLTFAGQSRYVHVEMVPEMNELGEVSGCIVLKYDVTSRIEMEKSLETAVQASEAANKSKNAFLASISHEMRTPLGVMLGFSDLLEMSKLTEQQRSQVNAIKRNGQALLAIINDLLDLAKIESGRMEIERKKVPVRTFFADLIQQFSILAMRKGLRLDLAIDISAPETITTDELKLRQILTNIIGNAIKFTASGMIKIHVSPVSGPRGLKISVEDTGPGIALEEQESIFEPFVQSSNTHAQGRKQAGTGLGLALAKDLTRLLGGNLWLDRSRQGDGGGSVFCLFLPPDVQLYSADLLAKPSPPSLPESPPFMAADERHSRGVLAGKLILAADDLEDNRRMIKETLEVFGASVEIAVDGEEVLRRVQTRDYDAIVMDLQMPNMDGYQAVLHLRRRGFFKPVIAVTAAAMKGEHQRCRSAGFNDYLSKPFAGAELADAVQKHCRASRRAAAALLKLPKDSVDSVARDNAT